MVLNSKNKSLPSTSLCEVLDGLLNTGVVVAGEIVISVADVDLVYIDLRCLLSSVKTAFEEKA